MSDLLDDLDNFALDPETKEDGLESLVLPSQRDECTPGNHALVIGRGAWNPLVRGQISLNIEAGFIYDEVTWGVYKQMAQNSEEVEAQYAEAEAKYAEGLRFGKWYSENGSEMGFRHIADLMPCNAEEAEFAQYCDYTLPLIGVMSDWFRPRFESMMGEFNEIALAELTRPTCELCGEELFVSTDYTGRAVFTVYQGTNPDGDTFYQAVQTRLDTGTGIEHAHLVCGTPDCIYNEHVDLDLVEVRHPGKLGQKG